MRTRTIVIGHEGALPGGAWGGEDLADPHAFDSPSELIAVDTVTITEQVGRSRIIRERLDKLAGGPGCRAMVGDVEVDEPAAVVAKDDEGEQQAFAEAVGVVRNTVVTNEHGQIP